MLQSLVKHVCVSSSRLCLSPEILVPHGQKFLFRAVARASRNRCELLTMQLLQTVTKHRPINFLQYVLTDLDNQLGRDTHDVSFEGCVMDLAQGKPVRDSWLTLRMGVWDDMSGIEQLSVA